MKPPKVKHVPRKRFRRSGMPAWALALVVFGGLGIAVTIALLLVFNSRPSPYEEVYKEAFRLEEMGDYETAISVYGKIPEADENFGPQALLDRERLLHALAARDRQRTHQAAKAWFEKNIMVFIHKYLDAPEDDPVAAKRIRLRHQEDRSSYIRVLIRNRIDPYLEDYPDQEDSDRVRELRAAYLAEWDENAPPMFRDIELEAETWLVLSNFGKAYRLMADWEVLHTGTPHQERIDKMKETILKQVRREWGYREEYVREKEASGDFGAANKIYHRLLTRCEGCNDPEVMALCREWTLKFKENEARLGRGEAVQ